MKPILKPCSFPEDGISGGWLPLVLVQLWDSQQCWSWHRNGTEGVQHMAWTEVSALYHCIQGPQKLHSVASLENLFLTHFSCFFFSYLLLVGFFPFYFPLFFSSRDFFHSLVLPFLFFSLKWFGECDALCWQSICGLKNEERCFALA